MRPIESKLERLVDASSKRHGEGSGDAISGALMFSHGVSDQIKVFARARARQIVLRVDKAALDAVEIKYR
jgi:hypothetical protein